MSTDPVEVISVAAPSGVVARGIAARNGVDGERKRGDDSRVAARLDVGNLSFHRLVL